MENPEQAFADYASSHTNEVGEKFDNAPTRDIAKDSMACVNAMFHDHLGNGEPPNKGIKSSSKLLSPKSQSSLKEQNVNSSSPKSKNNNHDTIVEIEEKVGEELSGSKIVIGEDESRDIKWDNPDDRARGDTKEAEEVEEESEESEEELEEELEEEEEEEEEDDL
ncbi:hypothetical protein Tco_0247663 [Tanacetum coccineum]